MSRHNWVWLSLVVILGAGLRLYQLDRFPPALNWDEVSLGYNAYSLLKTGRDEWGQILPTIFRAYGDYKLPVYVYLAVVSQAILGLAEVAIRLPSLVAGVGLIVVTYVLATKFFSSRVAIVTAFLVAVSPWTVWLSRIALEANVGAFFVAVGMYYLLSKKFTRSLLLLGVSVWVYNSSRIFVPLILLAYGIRFRPKLSTINYLLLTVLFLPMFWQLFTPAGQARYQWLAILDKGAVAQINQLQSRSGGRFLYNKATYLGYQFAKNYLAHFSPSFLFFKGGSHYQFSIPGHGLLYLINLPFFYLGIWYLFRNWKLKIGNFLLVWLLLSPIAGSITRDSPHVLRGITMLPLPMLISAVGLEWVASKWRRPVVVGAVMLIIALQLDIYLSQAFSYRSSYSWAWQYGYKQVVQFIRRNYGAYDQIVFTKRWGEPHEFVLYFWPWDPATYRQDPNLDRYALSDWFWVDGFAKFRFVNNWEMPDYVAGLPAGARYLVVASPDNEPPGREVYRVNFLDNKPAFIVKEL